MGLFSTVGQAYRFLCAVYGGAAAWAVRAALQCWAQTLGGRRWQQVTADVLFLPAVFALALAVCLAGTGRPEHFMLPGMVCGYALTQTALGPWAARAGSGSRRAVKRLLHSRFFARFMR